MTTLSWSGAPGFAFCDAHHSVGRDLRDWVTCLRSRAGLGYSLVLSAQPPPRTLGSPDLGGRMILGLGAGCAGHGLLQHHSDLGPCKEADLPGPLWDQFSDRPSLECSLLMEFQGHRWASWRLPGGGDS